MGDAAFLISTQVNHDKAAEEIVQIALRFWPYEAEAILKLAEARLCVIRAVTESLQNQQAPEKESA